MSARVSFHGLLLVNKPSGPSSHDYVQSVRRVLKTREIGHSGTLDPFASGLMVLLVGEATKLSSYITSGDKGYEAHIRLGAVSDTLDRTGAIEQVVASPVHWPTIDRIHAVLRELTGEFDWELPHYSAAQVKGRRLYDYARAGEQVPRVSKRMRFYEVQLLSYDPPNVVVSLKCSKGSFIRSFASQFGEKLGVGALVEELRRTWSEPFTLESAVQSLEELQQGRSNFNPAALIDLKDALPLWPSLELSAGEEKWLRNGQIPHNMEPTLQRIVGTSSAASDFGVRLVSAQSDQLVAILLRSADTRSGYKIGRVFNS